MKIWRCVCVVVVSLLGATRLHAQDVGFANAWPELDAQGREQVMRYVEDFKTFLGNAKSEMQFVREATRFAGSGRVSQVGFEGVGSEARHALVRRQP